MSNGKKQDACPHCGYSCPGVTNRVANQPLDSKATAAANAEVEKSCPRLRDKTTGTSRKLTMSDDDYYCRRKWMDTYLASLGEEKPKAKPANPTVPCKAALGDLGVLVTCTTDGSPLEGATVTITGPESRSATTPPGGAVTFEKVTPGEYEVTASIAGLDPVSVMGTAVAAASTVVDVKLGPASLTLVRISKTPKKIVHPHGESVSLLAILDPPHLNTSPPPPCVKYVWAVDGVVDATATGPEFTRTYEAAATVAERRRDFNVTVKVAGQEAGVVLRVAQNTDVGTANVSQDNAGLDTYGYTDTNPATFDTALTAAEDTAVQTQYGLTRQVRKQTLASGAVQYGRLQFASSGSGDAFCTGWTCRHAVLIGAAASAFGWKKEELDAMLDHELIHAGHRTASTTSTNIWARLWNKGFAAVFVPFTETPAYFSYVQSTRVSYKWLLDYGAIGSFVREYNNAKTALATLTGADQTEAKAILKDCYDSAQYPELREPASDGWDHHIDAP